MPHVTTDHSRRLFAGFLIVAAMLSFSSGPLWAVESAAPAEEKPDDQKPVEAETDGDTKAGDDEEDVPIYAEIRLTGSYPEGARIPGLFGALTESLDDALARLEQAANDDRIEGVILIFDGPGELSFDWSSAYSFRRAIAKLRDSGKPVYAWMPTADTTAYLVAAACDRVYMPESGSLMMMGLRAEVTFYKNLFDKLDIDAEMLRVGKFKSAAEPFTRTEMSPEFRKEMEVLLDDLYGHLVTEIAGSRDLEPDQVRAAIDSGPLTAGSARQAGLVDGFSYEDAIEEAIAEAKDTGEIRIARKYAKEKRDTDFSGLQGMIKLMDMMMGVESGGGASSGPQVAVIYASGAIMTGKSQSGLFAGSVLGSKTMTKAIETARDDEDVVAIVLRVDSPGGSALASDLIWRGVELAKGDKPVLVSMGGVAASGGYYISMGADAIVAEPATITGSIGVVGGKLAFGGLLEKVGITTSVISRGENSGTLSLVSGFNESQRQAMQKMLDDIYQQFTSKAAAGRGMELDKLKKLAAGRIYSGTRAKEIGLIDEVGSLEDTIKMAKARAIEEGLLEEGEEVDIQRLPEPKSPFEALFGPLEADAGLRQPAAAWSQLAEGIDPRLANVLAGARMIQVLARERVLTIMPFRVRIR